MLNFHVIKCISVLPLWFLLFVPENLPYPKATKHPRCGLIKHGSFACPLTRPMHPNTEPPIRHVPAKVEHLPYPPNQYKQEKEEDL